MTEAEWLTCTDPQKMLECLGSNRINRKLSLFALACYRRVRHWSVPEDSEVIEDGLDEQESQELIEAAEAFLDGQATALAGPQNRYQNLNDPAEAALASVYVRGGTALPFAQRTAHAAVHVVAEVARNAAPRPRNVISLTGDPLLQAAEVVRAAGRQAAQAEEVAQCSHLRCIFGNSFHTVAIDLAWLSWHAGTITKLAQSLHEDRALPSGHLDNHRLAILADALEDAGCDNQDILKHCRSDGPHVRGCWVVDLLLGKG
jgi:hypothetical protein